VAVVESARQKTPLVVVITKTTAKTVKMQTVEEASLIKLLHKWVVHLASK